jgi:hypothetical protein
MPLTARLNSPLALFRKLEREAYRAYHAPTPLQKSDHFFNFCVTASSMRDYCLEHQGMVTRAQRKPFDTLWWKEPLLVAAIEIGNATKHFVLRDLSSGTPRDIQTKTARMKKSRFAELYLDKAGDLHVIEVQRAEVTVTLSDKTRLELHEFTKALLDYWRKYLTSLGIKVRRQSHAQLSSSSA